MIKFSVVFVVNGVDVDVADDVDGVGSKSDGNACKIDDFVKLCVSNRFERKPNQKQMSRLI